MADDNDLKQNPDGEADENTPAVEPEEQTGSGKEEATEQEG